MMLVASRRDQMGRFTDLYPSSNFWLDYDRRYGDSGGRDVDLLTECGAPAIQRAICEATAQLNISATRPSSKASLAWR